MFLDRIRYAPPYGLSERRFSGTELRQICLGQNLRAYSMPAGEVSENEGVQRCFDAIHVLTLHGAVNERRQGVQLKPRDKMFFPALCERLQDFHGEKERNFSPSKSLPRL